MPAFTLTEATNVLEKTRAMKFLHIINMVVLKTKTQIKLQKYVF